ncbi:MAG: hypothetical protein AVDCRST_MAG03-3278, partial [uncultured Rubrobacteraceae bacterium]
DNRARGHPVLRARRIQADGAAALPLADLRLGDSSVPCRDPRGRRFRPAQPSWGSRGRVHREGRRGHGVRRPPDPHPSYRRPVHDPAGRDPQRAEHRDRHHEDALHLRGGRGATPRDPLRRV